MRRFIRMPRPLHSNDPSIARGNQINVSEMTDDQAFQKLCGALLFHNLRYDGGDGNNWIGNSVAALCAGVRAQAKRFIRTLLASQKTDRELQDIWSASGPEVYVAREGQLRLFLQMIEGEL